MERSNRNQNNSNSNNTNQFTKRTGAKMGTGKNGAMYIQGWNATRGQMMTVIASMKKEKNLCHNSKGEPLEIWVCKIKQGISEVTKTGFYNPNDRKLRIPDLNMVVAPFSARGGYFGKSVYKK